MDAAVKSRKTINDFTWKFGLKVATVILSLVLAFAYLSARYTIGLDTQTFRCLDEWIFIIDKWDRPTPAEIDRGEYIAVAMRADQSPTNALWNPGQVMVKRAMATDPGDVVAITRNGTSFHNAENTSQWAHGTQLEAAHALGMRVEDLERTITLEPGEIFMMADNPMSYDGRYYGVIDQEQIVGRVVWAF